MLQPVVAFEFTGLRQIIDIAKDREAFGARR